MRQVLIKSIVSLLRYLNLVWESLVKAVVAKYLMKPSVFMSPIKAEFLLMTMTFVRSIYLV